MKLPSILVCSLLLGSCISNDCQHSIAGTWKRKDANVWLRFYPGGHAAQWGDRPQGHAVSWATYSDGTITFNDWDANLVRRGPNLMMKSETGDELYFRVHDNLEPRP